MGNSQKTPIKYFTEIMADDERGFSAYTIFIDTRRSVELKYAVRIELSRFEIEAGIVDVKARSGMFAHSKMMNQLETVAPDSFRFARALFGESFK